MASVHVNSNISSFSCFLSSTSYFTCPWSFWERATYYSQQQSKVERRKMVVGVVLFVDALITQAVESPLSKGIPTYSVQIYGTCQSDCRIRNLHVSCGLFASAKLVNPRIFRRMGPNDCIVNEGKPQESGVTLFCVRQFLQLSHGHRTC